jgi:hypothetical protein
MNDSDPKTEGQSLADRQVAREGMHGLPFKINCNVKRSRAA